MLVSISMFGVVNAATVLVVFVLYFSILCSLIGKNFLLFVLHSLCSFRCV